MCRHEAGADDCFPITDSRVDGRDGEDALLEEALRESKGLGLATDENGNNRALGGADLESDRLEAFMHLAGVLPEHLDTLRFGLHDLEGLENSTCYGWREGSREDKAAGLVLHELDEFVRSGDEPPHGTEGL